MICKVGKLKEKYFKDYFLLIMGNIQSWHIVVTSNCQTLALNMKKIKKKHSKGRIAPLRHALCFRCA